MQSKEEEQVSSPIYESAAGFLNPARDSQHLQPVCSTTGPLGRDEQREVVSDVKGVDQIESQARLSASIEAKAWRLHSLQSVTSPAADRRGTQPL